MTRSERQRGVQHSQHAGMDPPGEVAKQSAFDNVATQNISRGSFAYVDQRGVSASEHGRPVQHALLLFNAESFPACSSAGRGMSTRRPSAPIRFCAPASTGNPGVRGAYALRFTSQQHCCLSGNTVVRVEKPMTVTTNDIEARLAAVLEEAFEAGVGIYNERGFKRRIGYGNRPAVIHIDLANAWTRPGHPFTCAGMDQIIPNVQRINDAARAKGVPVFYTTNVYRNRDAASGTNDMGLWYSKIPTETLPADSYWAQIDDRIAPAEGEVVIEKNRASAFPGTNLELFLTSNRIDTLIVTGATAAGCVRHTVEDAIAKGFRPIIPRETIGDRVPGVVQWNLYDIDNKFGDVESTDSVVQYLNDLPQFSETVPKTLSDPQPEVQAPSDPA